MVWVSWGKGRVLPGDLCQTSLSEEIWTKLINFTWINQSNMQFPPSYTQTILIHLYRLVLPFSSKHHPASAPHHLSLTITYLQPDHINTPFLAIKIIFILQQYRHCLVFIANYGVQNEFLLFTTPTMTKTKPSLSFKPNSLHKSHLHIHPRSLLL